MKTKHTVYFVVLLCMSIFGILNLSAQSVTINHPNNGTTWVVGDTVTVGFTTQDCAGTTNVASVCIGYKDVMSSWDPYFGIQYPIPITYDGLHTIQFEVDRFWHTEVERDIYLLVYVYLYDNDPDTVVIDTSDVPIIIFQPNIAEIVVTDRELPDNRLLVRGTDVNITWETDCSGPFGAVKIQLFMDGLYQKTIVDATPNDESYTWHIPSDRKTGNECFQFRISSVADSTIFDDNSPFSICDDSVQVAYPSASGIMWQRGTKQTITWTTLADLIPAVKIQLSRGLTHQTIVESTPNTGSYTWQVPADQATGTNSFKIRISSTADDQVYDDSDNPFSILKNSSLLFNIDGRKDLYGDSLTGPNDGHLKIRPYAFNENGRPVNDGDLSGKTWAAWDDEWFYLYEEVMDDTVSGSSPNVWEEDALELFIDPQPTDSTDNSIWHGRLTALAKDSSGALAGDDLDMVGPSGGFLARSGGDDLDMVEAGLKYTARRIIPGGYALEMAVAWTEIAVNSETVTPAVGNRFGMGISLHDNDGRGRRQASLQWGAKLTNEASNTSKYLGTVEFLPNHRLKFLARNNMTGLTNAVPYDGSDYTASGVEESRAVPDAFGLSMNYPNPFNPSTKISYGVTTPGNLKLAIYNSLGRRIRVLKDGYCPAGTYDVAWDGLDDEGKSVGTGIYIAVLRQGGQTATRKMLKLE
jgi:hypothetical protein